MCKHHRNSWFVAVMGATPPPSPVQRPGPAISDRAVQPIMGMPSYGDFIQGFSAIIICSLEVRAQKKRIAIGGGGLGHGWCLGRKKVKGKLTTISNVKWARLWHYDYRLVLCWIQLNAKEGYCGNDLQLARFLSLVTN